MASPSGSLRDARVLVTGASGFLGRHLLARLRQVGAEVIAVSRRQQPAEPGMSWAIADPSHPEAARVLVERARPDVLVHLASAVSGDRASELVWPMLRANLESTVALLLAAASARCRFVQVGSLEEPPLDVPPEAPPSPYAASKMAATTYCRLFSELYALPVAIARVFMVYGPGPQDENKLVPYVIRRLLASEQPALSSGTRAVDWIYAADVVEGLLHLAADERALGRQWDLGSGELVPVREVVERVHRLCGGPAPAFGALPDRPLETARVARAADTARALGWQPRVGLDEGLARTLEWFRSHPAPR